VTSWNATRASERHFVIVEPRPCPVPQIILTLIDKCELAIKVPWLGEFSASGPIAVVAVIVLVLLLRRT
jgi:hypothetical protein